MKNENGATSLEILLTLVILLIIAGTAIAMIAGSFETKETSGEESNQVQQESVNAIEDDQSQITKEEE